jgi:rhamnogalacturonyl hydrolase YesR
VFFVLITANTQAQKIPLKKDVLEKMRVANAYFMQKWPDPGTETITDKVRPSNIWTRAVYYEGLMALYKLDPNKKYYDYAVDWGEKHNWGMRSGTSTRNADDQACGQTYIELYQIDPKPERIRDIKLSIDNMLSTEKLDDWNWVDALQMAMPVFAKLGVIYNDNRYFERMYEIYNFTKTQHGDKGLFNPVDGLWWRDKDFDPPYKEANGENCYWSRGNGWVVAALVRILEVMPKGAPHRDEYQNMLTTMCKALVPLQRTDGFWNVSLRDPGNFGGKETSGTSLFAYGIAWGINNGVLDKKEFLPPLLKAWNAISKDALHANGFLGYMQGTGKEPKDSQPVTYDRVPNFEDYGLGCYLLAASEIYKLK